MTVVKVQKPIAGEPLWLVYDRFKARLSILEKDELPRSVIALFDSAPPGRGQVVQYLDNAEWNQDQRIWDLSKCTPATRRLIW